MVNLESYERIKAESAKYGAEIIAVSKKKPEEDILALMKAGQKMFGENYVQELLQKQKNIEGPEWHFIGHLQSNKVKQIIPFVSMIHSVDSIKLLKEINSQAGAINRSIDCLIEIHIAKEETKTGLTIDEAKNLLDGKELSTFKNVSIRGLMSMATDTEDNDIIRNEFKSLRNLFEIYKSDSFAELSIGMTSDYRIALEEGSTMIRIGSAIFGTRI